MTFFPSFFGVSSSNSPPFSLGTFKGYGCCVVVVVVVVVVIETSRPHYPSKQLVTSHLSKFRPCRLDVHIATFGKPLYTAYCA